MGHDADAYDVQPESDDAERDRHLDDVRDDRCTAGVYTVWVQGHSSPVLLDHFYPVGISIGSVNRDFSTSGGAAVLIPRPAGPVRPL